jgi:hypothetical protein
MAAFISRSISSPQVSHEYVLSASVRSCLIEPQHEQVLELGANRSILTRCPPFSSIFCSRRVTNIPQPWSDMDLDKCLFRFMPATFRSSTNTTRFSLAIAAACWLMKSRLLFLILQCTVATFSRCLFLLLDPFVFLARDRCSFANFFWSFRKKFLEAITSPSLVTANSLIPRSTPTVSSSDMSMTGFTSGTSHKQDTYHLLPSCLMVIDLSRPSSGLCLNHETQPSFGILIACDLGLMCPVTWSILNAGSLVCFDLNFGKPALLLAFLNERRSAVSKFNSWLSRTCAGGSRSQSCSFFITTNSFPKLYLKTKVSSCSYCLMLRSSAQFQTQRAQPAHCTKIFSCSMVGFNKYLYALCIKVFTYLIENTGYMRHNRPVSAERALADLGAPLRYSRFKSTTCTKQLLCQHTVSDYSVISFHPICEKSDTISSVTVPSETSVRVTPSSVAVSFKPMPEQYQSA